MEFNSLEEIYTVLENDVESIKRDWELTSAMKRLADKTTNEADKEKIKCECL